MYGSKLMIKVNPRPSCSIHTFNLTSFIMTKLNAKKFALKIYFERGRSCLPPPFSHTNMLYSFVLVVVICLCSCYGILKCPTLPPHVPVNVTDLRPGNIKVVIAMGDSITAGFGMNGASAGLVEVRGKSHSIGGDPNATTLANYLKFYSPDIQGASLGQHVVEFCSGDICPPDQVCTEVKKRREEVKERREEYHPTEDVLNSAQSGSTVTNLITHQLDYLLKMMAANPNINIKEDWKLLTLFIGGNDLCGACYGTVQDPDEVGSRLALALEGIRLNIPRVFVQIIEIFNVSQVYDLSLKSLRCKDIHRTFPIECDCVFSPNATYTRQLIDIYSQQYNAQFRALAAHYQALAYPEFTVVTQPYGRNTALKNLPITILSDLDCFHPSLMGHEAMATALWNNMLTPTATKKTYLDLSDTPLCPTDDTLIYPF